MIQIDGSIIVIDSHSEEIMVVNLNVTMSSRLTLKPDRSSGPDGVWLMPLVNTCH